MISPLTEDQDGLMLLAGEPIVDWFKKRDIRPCCMNYIRQNTSPHRRSNWSMCLAGAVAYAVVEGIMSKEALVPYVHDTSTPIRELSKVSGIDETVLADLEAGYTASLPIDRDMSNPNFALGQRARRQLQSHFVVGLL